MPLQKQALNINFAQGLDLKTDPNQVQPGRMLALQNTVFNKGGLLQKRNGFTQQPTVSDTTSTVLATLNGGLLAIGDTLSALSQDTQTWLTRGSLHTVALDTTPLVRSSTSQTAVDAAQAPSGLVCAVFKDSTAGAQYQVSDGDTGQVIVTRTSLPAGAVFPRVFQLGGYFIITYLQGVGPTHLKYIAVPIGTPTNPGSPVILSSANPVGGLTSGYDGYVSRNALYLAYSAAATIEVLYLTSTLSIPNTATIVGHTAAGFTITADDVTNQPLLVWVTFFETAGINTYSASFDFQVAAQLPATLVYHHASESLGGMTSVVLDYSGTRKLTLYLQQQHLYPGSSDRSDILYTKTVTTAGVIFPASTTAATAVLLGVGLASKAFVIDNEAYMLTAFQTPLQPSYFLIDGDGVVIARLAYSNGGGYAVDQVLPSAILADNTASIAYLRKDLLAAVNASQGAPAGTNIYSQTGVNLAHFTSTNAVVTPTEIGGATHLTGGMLSMYDGVEAVEHGFHVWPEKVTVPITSTVQVGGSLALQQYYYYATYEWTDAAGNLHRSAPSLPISALPVAPPTFNFVSAAVDTGAETIDLISHTLAAGTAVVFTSSGTVPAPLVSGTTYYVIPFSASKIKVAATYADAIAGTPIINLTGVGSGTMTMTPNANQYSLQVFIPNLILTAKTGNNPVRLVLYRWSTAQQTPYQITSIQSPIINSTTTERTAYTDTSSDAQILGNPILYTNGGTVENIAAPACNASALFKSRLFLIDAEDENLLWYSKQVIEATPVEMSDLFTLYTAPTTGSQGSTGPNRCLAPMDDKLIVFKDNAAYYIVGNGPDNTGANNDFSEPVFISSTVGCANQRSIVFTPNGLMFQSDKGIWLLGRDLNTSYIGAPVEEFNDSAVLSAINVPGTNQIRFTLDNGVTLMYDYYFNQWGSFVNIPAISSTVYQGKHTYLNQFGQVFQESPGAYLDGSAPVLISFTTAWFNLAGLQGYERAYFFYLLGQYITPHKLSIGIAYDYDPSIRQQTLLSPDNFNPTYGEEAGPYGSGSPYGGVSAVEQWRIFLQQQKCQAFQITISEIYDGTLGVPAGAGLTLSGLNLVVGSKKGYTTLKPSRSIG